MRDKLNSVAPAGGQIWGEVTLTETSLWVQVRKSDIRADLIPDLEIQTFMRSFL